MSDHENENEAIVTVDENAEMVISEEAVRAFLPIQKRFLESCLYDGEDEAIEKRLRSELKNNLPEYGDQEISEMSRSIVDTLVLQEEKQQSLQQTLQRGESKESWFADEIERATAHLSARQANQYLHNLDEAISSANEAMKNTILTKSGAINQNPNLDGFIAETYLEQTFNIKATGKESPYRAEDRKPNGERYKKNSVDLVVRDQLGEGKIVQRYQSKYGATPKVTDRLLGNKYPGQRAVVPEGQQLEMRRKATDRIIAPDGTSGKPISKERAKQIQNDAQQRGEIFQFDWSECEAKDLAMGVGKHVGQSAVMGMAIGAGTDVVQKVWAGEEIDGDEVVASALVSGADFGVKAAAAGALKVGVEKGIISIIPKGTPASVLADIANIAVENVKICGEIASGEVTLVEGIDKMEQVTVSTVAGISASAKGMAIGATVGAVLGPIGSAVGGAVGATIGYIAGSKVAQTVVGVVQEVRGLCRKVITGVGEIVSGVASAVVGGIASLVGGIADLLGF